MIKKFTDSETVEGCLEDPLIRSIDTSEVGWGAEQGSEVFLCIPRKEIPHVTPFEVLDIIEKHLDKKCDIESVFHTILETGEFVEPVVLVDCNDFSEIGFPKADVDKFFQDKTKRDKFLEKF